QPGGEVDHAARITGGHGRQIQHDGTAGAEVLAEALAVSEAPGALDHGLGNRDESVLHEVLLGGQRDGAPGGGDSAQRGAGSRVGGVVATGTRSGVVGHGAARSHGAVVHGSELVEAGTRSELVGVPVLGVAVVIPAVTSDRSEIVHLV